MLGENGTVVSAKAKRPGEDAELLVQVLDPALYPNDDARAALLQNLEHARQVRHPGLAALLEVGEDQGLVYGVWEHVEGLSLARMLEIDGHFPEADALTVCQQLCEVLILVAGEGLVHGQLSLESVVVDLDGTPRLTGLGGCVPGGPGYSPPLAPYRAPEVDEEGPTLAGDLYALGVCLYQLLTGSPPQGDSVGDPREQGSDASEATASIVSWLTQADPAERYADPAALGSDLILALAGQPPLGPRACASEPPGGDTATVQPVTALPGFLQEQVAAPEPAALPGADSTLEVVVSSRGVTLSTYRLEEEVSTIGRASGNAIQIDNPIVSRRHAELRRRGSQVFLAALSATNSTVHDGREVGDEVELEPGDEFVLSERFHLRVEWDPSAPPPTASHDRDEAEPTAEPLVVVEAPSAAPPVEPEPLPVEEEPNPYEAPREPGPYDPPVVEAPLQATQSQRRSSIPAQRMGGYLSGDTPPDLKAPWRAPRGFVVFFRGGQEVRSFISHGFQIGQSHSCELRLAAGNPRKAALITRTSDGYRLYNVGPDAQGVTLNREPVADQAILESGDEIRVADQLLIFDYE
ncbi:MAG TPA: hypothetical protein DEA08_05295 [Planctomycetes bacterium]|nr:hypothetical protein [Planctomycetota bacterium]